MIITIVALIGSVVGAWLVAKRDSFGFVIWLVANSLWFIDAYSRDDYIQMVLWVYYSYTCVVGLQEWEKKDEIKSCALDLKCWEKCRLEGK
jgi:hypothetical protein